MNLLGFTIACFFFLERIINNALGNWRFSSFAKFLKRSKGRNGNKVLNERFFVAKKNDIDAPTLNNTYNLRDPQPIEMLCSTNKLEKKSFETFKAYRANTAISTPSPEDKIPARRRPLPPIPTSIKTLKHPEYEGNFNEPIYEEINHSYNKMMINYLRKKMLSFKMMINYLRKKMLSFKENTAILDDPIYENINYGTLKENTAILDDPIYENINYGTLKENIKADFAFAFNENYVSADDGYALLDFPKETNDKELHIQKFYSGNLAVLRNRQ